MLLFIIVFLFLVSNTVFSQERNYDIDTIQIKSEILKENRNIIIFKPLHFLKTDSVKFLYILDGETSNYKFQILKEHFRDTILNIVGIGIINTDRRRDLLYINAANKFLDFITSELIPLVEMDSKVKTRILYGHSFAAAFATYSMINKPNYFDCYIASSPTPIMALIKKNNFEKIDSLSKAKIQFFFSYGSKDMRQVRKWSQKLRNNLSAIRFTKLDWRFQIFEGRNHNNSDIPALIQAVSQMN